ncbi:MAG: DNA methyltransferase [Candidatus Heimdallarchaeota archaeon]
MTPESNSDSKNLHARRNTLNDLTGKQWVQLTKSWFTLKVRPRSNSELSHPGKFPSELVSRFLSFFTKKYGWVIDPFLGLGSTLQACKQLERNGIGIELNPVYVKAAKKNLAQKSLFGTTAQTIMQGNALELDILLERHSEKVGSEIKFDFCMTSPPYWSMLNKHRGGSESQHRDRKEKGLPLVYSKDLQNDIGNIEGYNEYLEKVFSVFRKLKPFMKEKGYLVVVLQNIRDEFGNFIPIAWDFSNLMKELYVRRQEQIWCQTDKKLGIWGYPTTYVANVHHHYCLIFQKQKKP